MTLYERPQLPTNLAEPCPVIDELNTQSWDDLALEYIRLVTEYGKCATKHSAVVRAWGSAE